MLPQKTRARDEMHARESFAEETTGLKPSNSADGQWAAKPAVFGSDATTQAIRNGFVRKVYGILSAQLLLTFGMIFVFVFVEPVKVRLCGMKSLEPCEDCPYFQTGNTDRELLSCMWATEGGDSPNSHQCNLSPRGGCFRPTAELQSWLMSCLVLTFVFICGITCCEKCAREVPTNYIVLFCFTLCEAVVLGITCLFVNAAAVGLAAAMTAAVTLGLTVYACTTRSDFTGMGPFLVAALLSLILCSFIGSLFGMLFHVPWLQNVYAGFGCLLFSFFIIYDTQMIVGGKDASGQPRKAQISVDDYVFAALNLYLDIINLFMYLLQLLNSRD